MASIRENQRIASLDTAPGFQVWVGPEQPLTDLTKLVNAACALVESRTEPTVLMMMLGATSPEDRRWPGTVTTQDTSRWERALCRLERLDSANIAVASQVCGGPALDLLLATDYRMATVGTQLLMPVNDSHVWPGMALHRLVHQVGLGRARQLILWGTEITMQQAMDIGLVDKVVPEVQPAVDAAAMLLVRVAGPEMAVRRQLLAEAAATSFDDAFGAHLAACDRELRRLHRDGQSGEPAPLVPVADDR